MEARQFFIPVVCALWSVSLAASACSNPTGPDKNSAKLTQASTLSEFLNKLHSERNADYRNLVEYDHGFSDFAGALSYANGIADPIAGSWNASPTFSYPTANGRTLIGPAAPGRKAAYTGIDLTNGLTIEGSFQAFWGVKDVVVTNNLRQVPFVMVAEGIVERNGVQKYRAIQSLRGSFIVGNFTIDGVFVNRTGASLIGAYYAQNIETLDTSDPAVPCIGSPCAITYNAIWVKQ